MYWFGLNISTMRVEVFYSRKTPTEEKYGNHFGYLTGGYKTKALAIENASYQFSCNPVFIDRRKKENR
jgi:hypothetical protein